MSRIPLWKLSGWACGAFLLGVLVHSPWPYAHIDTTVLSLAFSVTVLILLFHRSQFVKAIQICLFCLLVGLWRFEAVRLPSSNLHFLDPKAFAYEYTASNPWREAISERIQKLFPGDQGALLSGILYGERGLSKDAKTAFKTAGLTHIIAVSGSNVMLVVLAAMYFFRLFGLSRKQAFIALTILLAAFVWFVAPQAPVVRAAIMGWLIAFAPVVGRLPSSSRILLVSATAFTFWKPWSLAFDPSFALSFLATGGLMTWGVWLNDKLEKRIPWKGIRETVTSTLAATLMTTPYGAWAFGQATIFGLFTNLLALPLISWTMATGLIAVLIPNPIVALPAQGFLSALLWIANATQSLGFGSWSKLGTSSGFMIATYIMIAFAWEYISVDKPETDSSTADDHVLSAQ